MNGKIIFFDNPWPEGHQLKSFELGIHLHEGNKTNPAHATLSIDLESEDYHHPKTWEEACDDGAAQFEANPDLSDWQSMDVWNNYHACRLTTASTHPDLRLDFPSDTPPEFTLKNFSKLIDPIGNIDANDDNYFDARAFNHCYILGHDAVAHHQIKITKNENTNLYVVTWKGKYASAYTGHYDFERDFKVNAGGVPFQGYRGFFTEDDRKGASPEYREQKLRKLAEKFIKDTAMLKFIHGKSYQNDRLV